MTKTTYLSIAFSLLRAGVLLRAQTQLGTGSIAGTVVDPSGIAVPDAAVTVVSSETRLERRTSTTSSGTFLIPVLPAATYSITVEKAGFNKLESKDLIVTVGSNVEVTLKLQIGAVTTQVDVVDAIAAVDTTQTSETSLIDRTEIDNLPINGRRYDQFALLSPGVTRDSRVGLLSFHGIAGVFNNFTVEGNDDNQALFSEARGRTLLASSISANAIEQFQVPVSGFLPEYGRTAVAASTPSSGPAATHSISTPSTIFAIPRSAPSIPSLRQGAASRRTSNASSSEAPSVALSSRTSCSILSITTSRFVRFRC